MQKGSDLFIQALENEGVEYIFGIPGEENLDFLDSLKDSSIELVLTRHEQAAGFMAATYGRLTGKAGVCLSTLGPGATNLVTSVAFAQLGAMPLIVLTGQKPIKTSKQGKFQIIDVVDMMRPITKSTSQIVSASSIPGLVRQAFKLAEEERPGAVHLELPEDVAREESDEQAFAVISTRRPRADQQAVDTAVAMIQEAKEPLILIGAGANRKRPASAIQALISKTSIPFFNTQMGKGVVDERHELFLGTAALSSDDYLHYAIDRADLIINVGHDVVEKPPFFMKRGGKKVIHLNFFPSEIDPVYFPDHDVVGDIALSLEAITAQVEPQAHWNFDYYLKVKKEVESHIKKYFTDDRFPLLPQRLVNEIRTLLPDDGIVTLDNGIYKIWFARNYACYQPNTLLLDNALATMGAGLPAAIGAKLVHPERKVVAICGDGGFMMNSQEIETAVRNELDLIVIILNDSAYGMIKWKQEDMGQSNFGLDFNNPDFVAYAESYGANGHRITDCDSLITTLKTCLSTPGVHIIDCPIDYSLNHEILNVRIKEKAKTLD